MKSSSGGESTILRRPSTRPTKSKEELRTIKKQLDYIQKTLSDNKGHLQSVSRNRKQYYTCFLNIQCKGMVTLFPPKVRREVLRRLHP